MLSKASTTDSEGPFDPFNQSFTLIAPDGTPFKVSIEELSNYVQFGVRICINYSSQIGASFILLVVLLLLSRKEKRKCATFWLNTFALVFNTIRSSLQCLYFTSEWYNPYAFFSGDYSLVPRVDYGISVAADVFTLLLVICLQGSLVMQTRAVCVTMNPWHQRLVLGMTSTVSLTAIGFRLAVTITNSIAIMHTADYTSQQWIPNTSNYLVTGSICLFSTVLVLKLFFALRERRKMGLRQFGPMQVIFIMGCQSLLIPAMFSILQTCTPVPEFTSQTLTVLTIFLPLSSMWASSAAAENSRGGFLPRENRSRSGKNLLGRLWMGTDRGESCYGDESVTHTNGSVRSQSLTEKSTQAKGTRNPFSSWVDHDKSWSETRVEHVSTGHGTSTEQIDGDLEALGQHIQVTKTYQVSL